MEVAHWANIASPDANKIVGCAIGGPRNDGVCTLPCLAGLTIEEIVLLPGVATVADLDAVCPPKARTLPQPTAWFTADQGVTTNAAGAVTGWANRGSLGSALDVAAVGEGISLGQKIYGSRPGVVFPGGSTWFAVFRIPALHHNGKLAGGLFGWASGNNANRFCAFLANGTLGNALRTHMFGSSLDAPITGWIGRDTLLTFSGFESGGFYRGVDFFNGADTNRANGLWSAGVVPWTADGVWHPVYAEDGSKPVRERRKIYVLYCFGDGMRSMRLTRLP